MSESVVRLSEDDVRNIPDSAYVLVGQNEDVRYWEAPVELPNGLMARIRKTEYIASAELLAANEEARKASTERRYTAGSGSDKGGNMPMVQTASIPPNVFFREIAPRRAAGDKDHMRWWLNQPENAKFRVTDRQTRK